MGEIREGEGGYLHREGEKHDRESGLVQLELADMDHLDSHLVQASQTKVDSINPVLRRSRRLDAAFETILIPSKEDRLGILKLYSKKLPLDPSVVLEDIAASCKGYVGADLEALSRKILEGQQAVEWPIKHAEGLARLGISPARGVLLHESPGCSKTAMVKVTANSPQASIFSLSGAGLYTMYDGEGDTYCEIHFKEIVLQHQV
ncbi:hypothetical protein GIB67_033945 [Kingdonia uniflora]|uniref:Uncharacterized protein n=1 Tax=Kingdonia uniflora TaxID=39325 RepID=A0A7J7PAL8_9MAGN|nr:hypothetical protein GIB67_033945 [Kingdonia uniflora]